jgi:hypothetical protein
MGNETMLYDAITGSTLRSTSASDLLGGDLAAVEGLKNLVELGDGRILSGGLQLQISAKKVVCTSFDINWACFRCGPHEQQNAFKIRGVADSASP